MRPALLALVAVLCGRALADTTVGSAVTSSGRDRSLVYRPDENEVSRFEPDQALCAAMDTRLWLEPGARPLGPIRLGSEVQVVSVREPLVRHELRLDRWYQVRVPGDSPAIGWMFGGALTPFCLRGDLDGDGRAGDLATLYFDADGLLHVRSRVAGQLASGVMFVDEPDDFHRGGRIHGARLLPAAVAGIPLVEVDADSGHCCSSQVKYLSFAPRDIRRALELTDYFETSDRFTTRSVVFDPKTRTARVHERSGTKDEHERTLSETRAETRWDLVGRIYKQRDLNHTP